MTPPASLAFPLPLSPPPVLGLPCPPPSLTLLAQTSGLEAGFGGAKLICIYHDLLAFFRPQAGLILHDFLQQQGQPGLRGGHALDTITTKTPSSTYALMCIMLSFIASSAPSYRFKTTANINTMHNRLWVKSIPSFCTASSALPCPTGFRHIDTESAVQS